MSPTGDWNKTYLKPPAFLRCWIFSPSQRWIQVSKMFESNYGANKPPPWRARLPAPFPAQVKSSWWLNQPLWKIYSSKWVKIFPQKFGVNIPKIFELPPPRNYIQQTMNMNFVVFFQISLPSSMEFSFKKSISGPFETDVRWNILRENR